MIDPHPMSFYALPWSELGRDDLYDALRLRQRVFVVEQNCPYQDVDGLDVDAWHIFGRTPDRTLVAYCRLNGPGSKYDEPAIGRVVTAPEVRGSGAGRALMAAALYEHDRRWPKLANRIGAQAYLQQFYESFGYVVASEQYLEDGIPHYIMLRAPAAP